MQTKRPIRVALVNDYEVVVAGLNQMFANYTDRIEVVKLIANREVRERVDIALYDSFGQTAPEADSVRPSAKVQVPLPELVWELAKVASVRVVDTNVAPSR